MSQRTTVQVISHRGQACVRPVKLGSICNCFVYPLVRRSTCGLDEGSARRRQEATGFAVQCRNSRPHGHTCSDRNLNKCSGVGTGGFCMSSSNIGVLYYSGVPSILESVILEIWKCLE